jgi:hypothetical protein
MENALMVAPAILAGGGLAGGLWWWFRCRARLPEIVVWNASATRILLEEHEYTLGFYERRLAVLMRLAKRLPTKRREKILEEAGRSTECLEDYRVAIDENQERETIAAPERSLLRSRQLATEEGMQNLSRRIEQWYWKHSRHEKRRNLARDLAVVLARAPMIHDYFHWRLGLSHLAERTQDVPAHRIVSLRLADQGSALHQQAETFFKLIRSPGLKTRAVRRSRRALRCKLARFARSVMKAQSVSTEKTVTLLGSQHRHDPLAGLRRKAGAAAGTGTAGSREGAECLAKIWGAFDDLAGPGMGHYEGYLDFIVLDRAVPDSCQHELEATLGRCIQLRVIDKVTGRGEDVDFAVHFGRYLVFKADWLARAREIEVSMSKGQERKMCRFSLRTVEHRAVAIHALTDEEEPE